MYTYFVFRPNDMYTDLSGNNRILTSTNAVTPTIDFPGGPFAGAGTVFFNNAGVSYAGVTGSSIQSFRITTGTGINLYTMNNDLDYYSGFTVCMWFRAADGGTVGLVNSIGSQVMYSLHTSAGTTRTSLTRPSTSDMLSDMYISGTSSGSTTLAGQYKRSWTHYCGVSEKLGVMKHYFDCSSATCAPTVGTFLTDYPNILLDTALIAQGSSDKGFSAGFPNSKCISGP